MIQTTIEKCFSKCAGKSGERLDKKEQLCVGTCFDLYQETQQQVQQALAARGQKG